MGSDLKLRVIISAKDEVSKVMGRIGGSIRNAMAAAAKPVSRITGMLSGMVGAAGRAGRALWNFGARILRGVVNFARQLINRLRTLAIVMTALVVAATHQAIAAQMEFAKALAEVSTLVDTAQVSMAGLGRGVRDMAMRTGEAATSLTKGLYQTISAGVAAGDAVAFLGVAARSAVGGVTETAIAVDGLTTLMNAWGKSASDVTEIADSMFTAVKAGKTTFGELAGAYAYIAGTASAAGLSIDETNAALAAITTQGIPAQMAARGLNMALISITQPTDEVRKAAAAMGVELSEAALKEKGLIGVMQELDRATGGSVEKMGKLLGSSMAARAGLALTGAGGKKFAETLELMNNKAGAAAEAYEKMASTTERAWARLKARFNELKLMVGEGLANAFGNASNSISDFFDMLSDSGQLQEFVDSITDGLKRAVVAVAAGVGGIVAGIRFLVSEYAKSGGSITKIWESIARAHIEAVGFIVRVFKTIQMIVGETAASSVWDAMARVIFELFRFLQMQALEAGIRMIEALGKPLVLIGALLTAFALLTGNVAAAKLGLKIGKMVVGLIVARVALEAAHEGIRTMPFGTAGAGIKAATDAASNAMKDLPDKWKNAWNDPETVKATDKMREAVADVFGVDIPNIAGDAGKSTGDSFMSGLGDAISKGSAEARKAAEKALGGDIAAPEAAAPDAPRGWGPVRSGIEPPTAAAMAAREVQEAAAARAAAMRAAAKRTTEDATVAPATPSPSAAGDMPQPVMPPPEPGAPTDERGAPPLMPMRPSGAEMGDGRDMPGADIGGARDTGGPIPQPDINININIDGDVSDPDKLARAVGVEFDKRMGKWRWAATV